MYNQTGIILEIFTIVKRIYIRPKTAPTSLQEMVAHYLSIPNSVVVADVAARVSEFLILIKRMPGLRETEALNH